QAVQIGVQAAYSAMQAGAQVAQMPMIAPIADVILQQSGHRNLPGDDPNIPQPGQTAAVNMKDPYIQGEGSALAGVRENTNPS
ncbi:hypothetical protein M2C68_21725, partial [Pseudomonas sp. BAgro211]|nr:hypothetical protein [Pseudomonas sp. BAgro211]